MEGENSAGPATIFVRSFNFTQYRKPQFAMIDMEIIDKNRIDIH